MFKTLPRLTLLLLLNISIIGILFLIAPQQLPVTLYKLSLVTLAGFVGYWVDRMLYPYARPHVALQAFSMGAPMPANRDLVFCLCMLRRAIIVAAAMLAMGLGA
jgi:hypothetical protein